MTGLYLHIPFCKQSCHYCNFHFSTSQNNREEVLTAINKEINQKALGFNDKISTIYFGGGTPTVLTEKELNTIIENILKKFDVEKNIEITIEANPDDLTESKISSLSNSVINRISIGVQSFIDKELKSMNRAHDSKKAIKSIEMAKKYFQNISIDLLYGLPDSNLDSCNYNLDLIQKFDLNHISAYALTIEPKTALQSYLKKSIIEIPDEQLVYDQFKLINERLTKTGFINYEVCSFAKKDFFSQNNSAYWLRKKYIGIGPSAHTYDGFSRSWNISNNAKYISHINSGKLNPKREVLSKIDLYNEYVMTGLRTMWGVSTTYILKNFGEKFYKHFLNGSKKHIKSKNLSKNGDLYTVSKKGRFLTDGIAAELFLIKLK